MNQLKKATDMDQLKKATDVDQLKKPTDMEPILKITKFYEFRELSISFTRTHLAANEETDRIFENMYQQIVATADFGKGNTSKMRAPKKPRNTTKTVSSEKLSGTTIVGKRSRLRGDKMDTSKKSKTTTTKELVEPVTVAKVTYEVEEKPFNVSECTNKDMFIKPQTSSVLDIIPQTGLFVENEAGEKDTEKDANDTNNERKRKNSETSANMEDVDGNKKSGKSKKGTIKLSEVESANKENVDVDKKSGKPKKGTKKPPKVDVLVEHSAPDDNPKPVGMPNAKRIIKKFEQQCKPKTPIKKKKTGKTNVLRNVKNKPRLLTRNAAKLLGEVPKQPPMAEKHGVLSSCENILTNKKGPEQCVHSPVKKNQDETIRKKEELLRAAIEDIKRNKEAKSQKRAVQKNYEKETVASAAKKITQEEVKHVKTVEQPQVNNEDRRQEPQNQKVEKENAEGQQNTCQSDNYNIDDIESGDSTDDEFMPKKVIPGWAERQNRLEHAEEDQHIPPYAVLVDWFDTLTALHRMIGSLFSDNSNLTPRTSSAIGSSDVSFAEH